jgi:hypothetical protein
MITEKAIKRMKNVAGVHIGKKYDPYFGWSDDRLYCSEFVWKIYKRALDVELGKPRHIKEYKLDHPDVQKKLRERYGKNIPYDEPAISPQDILECPLLMKIPQK